MFIKQITVFLENTRGALRGMTKVLAQNEINMLALSVADTTSFGLARIIVRGSEVERACEVLRAAGYMAKLNHVVCVSVPNRPAGLDSVLGVIEENGISVEYMYSFNYNIDGNAVMILRLSSGKGRRTDEERRADRAEIAALLSENGVQMVSQEAIDALKD